MKLAAGDLQGGLRASCRPTCLRAILTVILGGCVKICDGCGAPADEAHVRRRIERLELATRYRPIHIQVLLLADAPPAGPEDDFYRVPAEAEKRSPESEGFFVETLAAAGIPREAAADTEAALAAFQHRGFYLAYALECPLAASDDRDARIRAAAPTIRKRIQFSYRPKQVILTGAAKNQLAPLLENLGAASGTSS
jgi:hypothetical protein